MKTAREMAVVLQPFVTQNYNAPLFILRSPAASLQSLATCQLIVERIRDLSPILRNLETAGKIKIACCIYDLQTGRARFLQ